MKKYIIFIFIILFMLSCFSGCTSKDNQSTPIDAPITGDNGDNIKYKDTIEKVNIADLNTLQNDYFAYINKDGHLIIRNTKDGSEQFIISDGFVYDYDFNYKDNKIAYIIGMDTDFINVNAVIYDINSKQRDVIVANTGIKAIGWSPSGKYIALTQGAGPGCGLVKIYDAKNKTWLNVPSEKGDGFDAIDFEWNPSIDILALEMLIHPDPPSPVGDGESFSMFVYFPEKNNSIKSIVEGSSNFGYDKFQWIDNETLSIRKNNYDKSNDVEYYKANINNGSIVKVLENERNSLTQMIPQEAYLYDKSLSSDGKLLLYSYGGGSLDPTGDIYLWDIIKQTKELICQGRLPKWIVNYTVRAE